MGQKDKLIARLMSQPKDFTFDEAETLMKYFSFQKENKGKTSGSRTAFINKKTGAQILLHSPHPQKEMKRYQIRQLIEFLRNEGNI